MAHEPTSVIEPDAPPLLAGAYRLGARFDERATVERFVGHRVQVGRPSSAVVLVREPVQDPSTSGSPPGWPSLAWEEDLRARLRCPGLARVTGRFEHDGFRYLVLDSGEGRSLWDAWDDPAYGAFEHYAWLAQLTELLDALHQVGVILESLRPDQVLIDPFGRVLLDATIMPLPVPLPVGAPLRPTLASAPELVGGQVDARSDLYCFGSLLCALHLGHELTDLDCLPTGDAIPFAERFPDAHPFLVRLIGKTMCRERSGRFPTGPSCDDLGGFIELHRNLRQAQRLLARSRLDVAAWSSLGMVRSGNEDALAIVRAVEAREDSIDDLALVIVADGIGGCAAGEVAAVHAVRALRRAMLLGPPFHALTDEPGAQSSIVRADPRQRVVEALKEANRHVYRAARQSAARHGMACTAELVYFDGRQMVVGHVGDSRTYHFHQGRLEQLTEDHTLVYRLVQLGQLTPQEAETHPRRGELEQAIGGRAEVEPSIYTATLTPGDWILVCSDGLTQRVKAAEIQDILERAPSAEHAARRLINRANQYGADDNVTAVVVRAC